MMPGRAGTGGDAALCDAAAAETHGGMHRGLNENGEAVLGLRKGPWGHPHADRIALVPPRCGKQRPARIDRSLSADTASSQRSEMSGCSSPLSVYAMQMRNSVVTGSNRYLMLLVCPINAGTQSCKALDLLHVYNLGKSDRLP